MKSLALRISAWTVVCVAAAAPGADLVLRYDRPAMVWAAEALPIGNGRLGAMIFGGLARERIQFNEDSLWTGDLNPSGDYKTMGAYQNFGDLFVDWGDGASSPAVDAEAPAEGYSRSLALTDGVHRVTFRAHGAKHLRETFASHPDQVVAIRWAADRPGAVTGAIRLQGAHGETTASEGASLAFSGTLSNGLRYAARVHVSAKGGTVTAQGGAVRLDGCDEAVLLLAAGTDYAMDAAAGWRGAAPGLRLQAQLDAAAARGCDALLARHIADHRALMDRVSVEWGASPNDVRAMTTDRRLDRCKAGEADPELDALLFQYGRYLLMASSRRPGLPANLQGLWNDSNNPAWSSDYHSNINVQMNYWPAEPANLAECALPFFDLAMAMRGPSRAATQAEFGKVRGWTARTSHNIFGGHGWKWNLPSSAWYALHFWEQAAFGGDHVFLRDTAYPMAREVCEFWIDHLKTLPDGTVVVPNGWSPEHGPTEDGVAHDQQIVWELFTFTARMAEDLGVDPGFRKEIAALRDRLAGPKVGRWGQLQEWMEDRDDPKDQHRHTSHLFAVFPGGWISFERTPEWAKAARTSLEARGTSGDSRREWAWAWRSALWARLREGDRSHEMIRNLLAHNTLPNLFGNHPPMQLDGNFGICAGICEMLVQSLVPAAGSGVAAEIDLLPALPAAWPNGRFRGLRARGVVTVDAEWCGGKPVSATLAAGRDGRVVLRAPASLKSVRDADGRDVPVRDAGNGRRAFDVVTGGRYVLAFGYSPGTPPGDAR